jgi:hypothetical protein
METIKHQCIICSSAYIETTQKNIENIYICNMCKEYEQENNPNRVLPNQNIIDFELITDYGND